MLANETFDECTRTRALEHFNETFLTTDASTFAIGAVFSQAPIGKDGHTGYASRTLKPNTRQINANFPPLYGQSNTFRA